MTIRRLPQDVAAKIAAGEVVERPAAVVKELVENAIDAGARQVRVDLLGGGLELIRVSDDGAGLTRDELALAFARHATSKISALDDLERITTLGFRGEALASIAAVANVTLISRPAQAEIGAQISVAEGVASEVTATGAARGAIVTVRDLFVSVPARLKFLKTRATETGRCLQLVEQYALAYPEIRFVVTSEGRQTLLTAGDGKLRNVIAAVYGLGVAEQMAPLGAEEGGAEGAEPQGEAGERPIVSGYVSKPTCYKSSRQYMSFFVNRRWVQSRTLSFAVEEAYHSLLLTGRHPIAVVNISLDPALIDVNVHPAKTEIRFLRERQVYAAVQRATREAVLANAETPSVSSRGFSIPTWEPSGPGAGQDASQDATDQRQANLWRSAALETPAVGGQQADSSPAAGDDGNSADELAVGGRALPVLRVLGQVSQSYLIAEGPDGVYLVDQHAAHERILLERMIASLRERAVASQLLLDPLPVELAPAELEIVSEHLEQLRAIGFEIEPFGAEALLVRAVPAALGATAGAAQTGELRDLLIALAGADAEAASHGETWEEHALANVACRAAIKAGQTLAPEEQRELIRQLERARARQSCCHGRPTMVRLSLSALEREFDRR
jgi:DNA mismatch repair protein MutL